MIEFSPNNLPQQEKEKGKKSFREKIPFKNIEPIIKALEKHFEGTAEKIDSKVVEDIFYTYLEEKVNNTEIYKSEKYNVSFPWTKLNSGTIAKKLYAQYKNMPIDTLDNGPKNENVKEKDYIFTNFFNREGGSEFTFQEEWMLAIVEGLPSALESLEKGEIPEEKEFYTLGSPTNEFGAMSKEFLDKINGDNAASQLGLVYSEFIKKNTAKEKLAHIGLRGVSMAGSFAVTTGEQLIKDGIVTQSLDEIAKGDIPDLQIRIDNAPGQNEKSKLLRWIQSPLGFAAEGAYIGMISPYWKTVMATEGKFLEDRKVLLKERDIVPQDGEEQKKMQNKAIIICLVNLLNGVPIPEGLKVFETVGLYDPLAYSHKFNKEVEDQKREHGGTLGANLVSKDNDRRIAGIRQTHFSPVLRETNLRKIQKAVKTLNELREQK